LKALIIVMRTVRNNCLKQTADSYYGYGYVSRFRHL